jgi:hypothetical protein
MAENSDQKKDKLPVRYHGLLPLIENSEEIPNFLERDLAMTSLTGR